MGGITLKKGESLSSAIKSAKAKSEGQQESVAPDGLSLSVKDTDFLLKLIMESSFKGTELEQAYKVTKKLAEEHRRSVET